MKFSSPIYKISENGLVVTVSITIEGQEVHYSYTSEQAMITKKHIKQCEENVAEIAFTALTEQMSSSGGISKNLSTMNDHYSVWCILL